MERKIVDKKSYDDRGKCNRGIKAFLDETVENLDLAARLGDDRWQLEGASNCRLYPQGHDSSCLSYITVDHWRLLS